MKITILTSPDQWFIEHAKRLNSQLSDSSMITSHDDIPHGQDVVFILSYHKIIPKSVLIRSKHNIVVHASDLPEGKGWAPMFWQILEGKSSIPFTMFEATEDVDDGDIYMKSTLELTGYELNDELRRKQADTIIDMCTEFVSNYSRYKRPCPQEGRETFYIKRGPEHSELDVNKTIKDQFNLLRVASNSSYPAFFMIDGRKFILKIEAADKV